MSGMFCASSGKESVHCPLYGVIRCMNAPLSDGGGYIAELRTGLELSLPNMASDLLVIMVILLLVMLVIVAIALYSKL